MSRTSEPDTTDCALDDRPAQQGAAVFSLHIPMSLWPAVLTPELRGPPQSEATGRRDDDELDCRVGATLAVLRCAGPHLWGAEPKRRGSRIDCWITRRNFAEGITTVEDIARRHGLSWMLAEGGEVGVPTYLADDFTLGTQLERLRDAGAGGLILESGKDLDWYVQVLLDDDDPVATVEAVAGRFSVERLRADQRRVLLQYGFSVPGDMESRNAHRTHALGSAADRAALVELMQGVMREVYECRDHHPVVMRLRR